MAFSRMLDSFLFMDVTLRTRRFLPGEAIPQLAGGLPRCQRAAARSDIPFLEKAL
jgi:hypothetical protein